jgi:hypothetical protein
MAWHWSHPIVVGADLCSGWSGSIESMAELPCQLGLTTALNSTCILSKLSELCGGAVSSQYWCYTLCTSHEPGFPELDHFFLVMMAVPAIATGSK